MRKFGLKTNSNIQWDVTLIKTIQTFFTGAEKFQCRAGHGSIF